MPTWYASEGSICAFNSITGVMLVNPEVCQACSHRSDLSFKQELIQATHTRSLMESRKGYSIAAAWGCWEQWGCDKQKAWNSRAHWKYLKPVLPSPESLANPCPRPMTILFKQQTFTNFGVPEAGSIDSCCCHSLFFFHNILRQWLHWVLPTASEFRVLLSFIVFSKLEQIAARSRVFINQQWVCQKA